jgi:hypothetical protein
MMNFNDPICNTDTSVQDDTITCKHCGALPLAQCRWALLTDAAKEDIHARVWKAAHNAAVVS